MGFVASVLGAVTLTLHPGQTLHIGRLHIGDAIVCRTPAHAIRWQATAANINSTGSFAWGKQLQLSIMRRGSKVTVTCGRR